MATEPTKPATRKPAARKTTSRPARKPATPKTAEPEMLVTEPSRDLGTPAQREAKISAYQTLTNAGLPVSSQLEADVIAIINEAKAHQESLVAEAVAEEVAEEKAVAETKGPDYILNTYAAPFSMRLERHKEKRRIDLKARGMRGDMHPILPEDLHDAAFIANLELGRFETITAGQAMVRSRKQTNNLQRQHTPLSILRNERGESYAEGSFKVEAEWNDQGVTVAYIDPQALKGQLDKSSLKSGGIQRAEQISQFVPTGGNPAIISDGFAAQRITDDIARRKTGESGPAQGLGGLTVTVDPVQRT